MDRSPELEQLGAAWFEAASLGVANEDAGWEYPS